MCKSVQRKEEAETLANMFFGNVETSITELSCARGAYFATNTRYAPTIDFIRD